MFSSHYRDKLVQTYRPTKHIITCFSYILTNKGCIFSLIQELQYSNSFWWHNRNRWQLWFALYIMQVNDPRSSSDVASSLIWTFLGVIHQRANTKRQSMAIPYITGGMWSTKPEWSKAAENLHQAGVVRNNNEYLALKNPPVCLIDIPWFPTVARRDFLTGTSYMNRVFENQIKNVYSEFKLG